MQVKTFVDRKAISHAAAAHAARILIYVHATQQLSRIISATGASKIEFL
jgi:hypothetical protein